ncbi:LuxR C-terminal-related transcriptional regulator [Streptomyces vinaceus]
MNQAVDSLSAGGPGRREGVSKLTAVIAISDVTISASLSDLLDLTRRYEVVGEASSSSVVNHLLRRTRPDFLFVDLKQVPSLGPLLQRLGPPEVHPKVLLVADDASPEELNAALDAGAMGFLSTVMEVDFLDAALRHIHRGGCVMADILLQSLKERVRASASRFEQSHDRVHLLNESEYLVLRLLGHGYNNTRIASELCLSSSTVKTYVSRVLKKLCLENRTQAALVAHELSLTAHPDDARGDDLSCARAPLLEG